MTADEVKILIEAGIERSQVTVKGDGSMFDTLVVSDKFSGLNQVKKQQLVYATVNNYITSGEIHALTIKTYTPDEWIRASKLQIGS
jgi:acid stress-induced BolA-like protein IbaG/YrbA